MTVDQMLNVVISELGYINFMITIIAVVGVISAVYLYKLLKDQERQINQLNRKMDSMRRKTTNKSTVKH